MNTTPEHLHLALNHLPFLGAAFAIIPLLIGFFFKSRASMIAGLLIAALSGWTTPLVMETGEEAYERYEDGPIAATLDAGAEYYLEEHEHRAEAWSKVFYAVAIIATIAFILTLWQPAWARIAAIIVAFGCVAALAAGIWIAESGGLIRRPDFRPDAAAVNSPYSQKSQDTDKD